MLRRAVTLALPVFFVVPPAFAQAPLTLADVLARVGQSSPGVGIAEARLREADARTDEARASRMPRVEVSEGWQRGDIPVLAFSARLSQRQFSAADFDVTRLNHPDIFDNFRATVAVDQPLFDPALAVNVRAAARGRDVATAARDAARSAALLAAVEAFGRVHFHEAMHRAALAAVEAAQADVDRASNRRSAGLATDADVLSLSVALQTARSRALDAQTEAAISRAQLIHLMGDPPGTSIVLAPLATTGARSDDPDLDDRAMARRPDLRLARAFEGVASTDVDRARASFLPKASIRAAGEWNGASFGSRAAAWAFGAEVRWTLFQGLGDRARLAAARAGQEARQRERIAAESQAAIEIGAARARVATAAARIDLARAALASARESQRITRDRYDNGLADATALLTAGRLVLDAEAAAVSADVALVLERTRLDAALGAL